METNLYAVPTAKNIIVASHTKLMGQNITECGGTKGQCERSSYDLSLFLSLFRDTDEKYGKLTPFEFGISDVIHP
jgi:hypothetical protein